MEINKLRESRGSEKERERERKKGGVKEEREGERGVEDVKRAGNNVSKLVSV